MILHNGSVASYGDAAAELAAVDWEAVWCPHADRVTGVCPHRDRSDRVAAATGWRPESERSGGAAVFRTASRLAVAVSGHSAFPRVDHWRVSVGSREEYHAACVSADTRWPALLAAVRDSWGEPGYLGFWLDEDFPGVQHPRRRRPRTRRVAVWIRPHCVLDLAIGDGGGGPSGYEPNWAITLTADSRPR